MAAVFATLAMGLPPNGVPLEAQDNLAETTEPLIGIEDEKRKQEDGNFWMESVTPSEVEYDYGKTGAEVTDSGKPEAAQAIDYGFDEVPMIHVVQPKTRGWIPCKHECRKEEYCWDGTCVYRPWKYEADPKFQCYPDPAQPGLNLEEKMRCRKSKYDKDSCKKAKYCEWLSDAPMWYKPFEQHWQPPPKQPGTLMGEYIAASKNFATAAVSRRDESGAEPLTRSQWRENAEGKYIGGTNNLPYDLRPTDDLRTWRDQPNEALQPMVMEVAEPWGHHGRYPINTTGPRFSENSTDPYWYMPPSLKAKFVKQDVKEAAKAAAEDAPPAPAPAAPAPAPGPAPGPAPAVAASPAFLEIRQIQQQSPTFLEIQQIQRNPYI